MNQCNFVGRVGQDPEIRYTQSGDAIANISIATTKRYKDKQGNKQEKTTWVKCSAFGKTAELIGQYVQKGSQLRVTTEYEQREYNDNNTGEKKYAHQFNIRDMEFLGSRQNNAQSAQQGGYQHPPQQQANNFQQPQQQNPNMNPNGTPKTPQQMQSQSPQYTPNDFDSDDVLF